MSDVSGSRVTVVVVVVCPGWLAKVVICDQEFLRLDTSFVSFCISRSQRCSGRQE
jgi:hypothetical protein